MVRVGDIGARDSRRRVGGGQESGARGNFGGTFESSWPGHRPGAAERYLSPKGKAPGLSPPQSHHVRLLAEIQATSPTLPFTYSQTSKCLHYSTEPYEVWHSPGSEQSVTQTEPLLIKHL